MTIGWIRFWIAAVLMACGLWAFVTSMVGIYRMRYVLNRLHVAAKCDTMGILLTLLPLMILSGLNFTTLKLFLIVVFMWMANPVSGHLIAHLEAETNPAIIEECEVIHYDVD